MTSGPQQAERPSPPPDPAVVPPPRRRLLERALAARPTGGMAAMLGGVIAFSVMSALVKAVGQEIPNQQIVLVRAAVTIALAWATIRAAGQSPWGRDRRLLVARGAAGFIGLSALYYAYVHLPLADATVIQMTSPIFTALLAAWLLRERLAPLQVVLAVVSLAGVVIVARPGFLFGGHGAGLDPLAVVIALAGAGFSAAAYVLVRRLRASESPMTIVFWFAFVSLVASSPLAIAGWVWPTALGWGLLLGIGVATHVGQVSITHGFSAEPAGRASGLLYLQVVFAAAWGWLFFAEPPDLATGLGAALIIGSAMVLTLGFVRRARRPAGGAR